LCRVYQVHWELIPHVPPQLTKLIWGFCQRDAINLIKLLKLVKVKYEAVKCVIRNPWGKSILWLDHDCGPIKVWFLSSCQQAKRIDGGTEMIVHYFADLFEYSYHRNHDLISREISISLCGYQSYLAYNCPSIIERLSEWTSDWLSAVVKKPWNDLEVPAFQFQCQLDGRQLKSPIWQLCNSPAFYFIFITLWPQTRSKFPQTIPMTKDIKKIPNKRPQKESPLNKV